MIFQLVRARRFNTFKDWLNNDIAPLAIEKHLASLPPEQQTDAHLEATKMYWSAYSVRVLQLALHYEILNQESLHKAGKWRFCQHLFFIQQQYLNQQLNTSKPSEAPA